VGTKSSAAGAFLVGSVIDHSHFLEPAQIIRRIAEFLEHMGIVKRSGR
jgi:hypothetical protein